MLTLAEMPRVGVSRPVRLSMARYGKWIEGAGPAERVAAVARLAIDARLEAVWARLPDAADGPIADAENVHQLRVASRRAVAALEIFSSLLPERRGKWLRQQLKRVRRAAGDARDLDVLAARLARRAQQPAAAFCLAVIDRIQADRRAAQEPICRIHGRLAGKDFPARQDELVRRVRVRDQSDVDLTFGQFARRALRRLTDEFFAAAGADMADINQLHAFRIQAKQLRYAMEVFVGAFGASFRRDLYPQVEVIQEQLGEVNDHAAACQRYGRWLADSDCAAFADGLTRLIAEEQTALAAGQARFIAEWTKSRSDRLRQGFDELLSPSALAG